MHLDSGHIRSEAHKLYFKEVLRLAHFILAKQFFNINLTKEDYRVKQTCFHNTAE
jgi:hypothetical protein